MNPAPKPPDDLLHPPEGTGYFYVNGRWMKYNYVTLTMEMFKKPGKTIPITEFMEGPK